MSAVDRALGRMEAVLKLTEERLEQMRGVEGSVYDLSRSIRDIARDMDDLRGIVGDITKLVTVHLPSNWLTTTELAAELKKAPCTVYRWYLSGKIRGHQSAPKDHIMFDRQEVAEDIRGWGAYRENGTPREEESA